MRYPWEDKKTRELMLKEIEKMLDKSFEKYFRADQNKGSSEKPQNSHPV